MSVSVTYTIFYPNELAATLRTRVNRQPKRLALASVAKEFRRINAGGRADVRGFISTVTASQTVTLDQTQAVNNTDKLTIGGTDISVVASPSTESQVAKGASTSAFCDNMVAAINAHSVISKLVWATVTTRASGIITVYSVVPGPVGNFISLAKTGNGVAVTGATLANGASDAVKHYQAGYSQFDHNAG